MSKQTVLITGCSEGGIGYALAKEFHRQGHRVIATARRLEAMTGLADIGIETLILDVSDDSSVQSVRDEVGKLLDGKLNVLVNNAGQSYTLAATDDDIDRARALFNVNVFGPMRMVKAFVDMLIASKNGRILQTGSVAGGIVPLPFSSTYNASKAALHAYGDTLRVELAPLGIKVITVVTGGVKTNLGRYDKLREESLYQPIVAQFDNYGQRLDALSSGHPMAPDVFARDAVHKAMARSPSPWVWSGSASLFVWVVHTFGRKIDFDSAMLKNFGLDVLAKIIRSKKE